MERFLPCFDGNDKTHLFLLAICFWVSKHSHGLTPHYEAKMESCKSVGDDTASSRRSNISVGS